jgi:hypothetical protein
LKKEGPTTPQTNAGGENTPIVRLSFEADALIANHPPRLTHPNKKTVYAIACPQGCAHSGTISFTRWHEAPLPEMPPAKQPEIEARADVFGYETPAAGATEWYLNFADQNLFFGYGVALFAQDEIQVAEHPALASLREALLTRNIEPLTREHRRPTPILVAGIERRCAIATAGIYGQRFDQAGTAAIVKATRPLTPPTISNIIAISAPMGNGAYKRDEIEFILSTAYTGFHAAKMEAPKLKTVIHTGYWGCGAFGGNRELMALLQLLAARLAGIDRVVFHTFDEAGLKPFHSAEEAFAKFSDSTVPQIIDAIFARDYVWGSSDGN